MNIMQMKTAELKIQDSISADSLKKKNTKSTIVLMTLIFILKLSELLLMLKMMRPTDSMPKIQWHYLMMLDNK